MNSWKRLWMGLIVSICCMGCGDAESLPRISMHGRVLVKGVPLTNGSISLLPAPGNDAPTANTMIQKGEYRFDKINGPLAGKYYILVMQASGNTGGKVPSDKSKPPLKKEWKLDVDVPDVAEFEHNIDIP